MRTRDYEGDTGSVPTRAISRGKALGARLAGPTGVLHRGPASAGRLGSLLLLGTLCLVLLQPLWAAEPTRTTAEFRVKASLLVFRATRTVTVTSEVDGLSAWTSVELDRPMKARFGVDSLTFNLRVVDEQGRSVEHITRELRDGEERFAFRVDLPAPGPYRLVLTDDDLDARPARLRIVPDGAMSMDIVGRAESESAARLAPPATARAGS